MWVIGDGIVHYLSFPLRSLLVSACFLLIFGYAPICPQSRGYSSIRIQRRFQIGQLEQFFEIVRPTFFGKLLLLKDGARGFDVGHNARLQATLNGVTGEVISPGPSAACQQTFGIANPVPGQLP